MRKGGPVAGPPFCFLELTLAILASITQANEFTMDTNNLRIEVAAEPDIPLLVTFIKELAEYEALLDHVNVTENRLHRALFGKNRYAHGLIAYIDDLPVAFAIYFFSFSTFEGLPSLYIEDIFVRPSYRKLGIGRRIFTFLSNKALEADCSRIELSVLNWNQQAIGFYKQLGGQPLKGWTVFRLSPATLAT